VRAPSSAFRATVGFSAHWRGAQAQLTSIFEILLAASRFLHLDERFHSHESRRHSRQQLAGFRASIFQIEVERLGDEKIDSRLPMPLTVQLLCS
jgi:hypothetical protein